MDTKNIILIGFGSHTRRTYYEYLQYLSGFYEIKLKAILELESEKKVIEDFLRHKSLRPEKIILLKSTAENDSHQILAGKLLTIAKGCDDCKILLATDPKSHYQYLVWAIENNIDILVEKPPIVLTGMNQNVTMARELSRLIKVLSQKMKTSTSHVVIQSQRRYNEAYSYAHTYLQDFIQKYKVPISNISIRHQDGMWNSPDECCSREQHSYKHGYGKTVHSGYHFMDIFMHFSRLNTNLDKKIYDKVDLGVQVYRPLDLFNQLNSIAIYPKQSTTQVNNTSHLGEIDIHALVQFKKEDLTITNGQISLMQNTESSRNNFCEILSNKKDMMTRKYEELQVNIGPLLSIKVESYKINTDQSSAHKYGFRVVVKRNSNIVGGETETTKHFSGTKIFPEHDSREWTLNQAGRINLLLDFLNEATTGSDLITHINTNLLISSVYEAISLCNAGKIPSTSFTYE